VNFDWNDEQRAIKESAHEMLAKRYPLEEVRRLALEDERGFTDEQWAEISSLGWPGIFVAEEHGGQGLGIVELVILQEELGYALAPTPFFSNACAGLVLQAAGDDSQKERWLAPLAAGDARGTVAFHDEDSAHSLDEVSLEADGLTLSGTKVLVAEAGSADFLIVAARGRPFLVATDADGVAIEATPGLDPTRRLFTVRLDGVEGDPLEPAPELEWVASAIATALSAESTGVAQRAMEMAVEYAKDRKQFEHPIGAFQAISHRCAQMLLEVEGARSTTYYAAWALDNEPQSAPLAASMAKAYASDAGWRVTASALQVHGGIGFTWEHDLHFFLKRARANAAAFGDARYHRGRVAELAGV
jgi:alkylation response protein AidB-like acyl-CoA dehydrogenase